MLTPEFMAAVAAIVQAQGASEAAMASLREHFPGVRFTLCSDDDTGAARPVHEGEGFALYLVGGEGHCLALTRDYSIACGVVVAGVEPE